MEVAESGSVQEAVVKLKVKQRREAGEILSKEMTQTMEEEEV